MIVVPTQLKGKIKEQRGEPTDDDLDVIAGKREQLKGKIQERYGLAKDQVRFRRRQLVRAADLAVTSIASSQPRQR
jgi:uncharacterized protein YjbJ (UPF0337 family)